MESIEKIPAQTHVSYISLYMDFNSANFLYFILKHDLLYALLVNDHSLILDVFVTDDR